MKMAKLRDFDRNEYGSSHFELSTGYPQVIHRKSTGCPHIHRLCTGYSQSCPQCNYLVSKTKRDTKVLLYRITGLAQNPYNNLTVTICYIWLQFTQTLQCNTLVHRMK